MIKTVMGVLFPIISFPYASRILGTEGIGAVSYVESIVNYFALFAALGISTYGIREAAKVRDDEVALGKLSVELLIINTITTVVAYTVLVLFVRSSMTESYYVLFVVQSLTIILTTIGMEWLFVALEEYTYIAIRSVIFQVLALIGLWIFVKEPEDYVLYAAINVFATVGCNIINVFSTRKFIKLSFSGLQLRKHLKPVLVIFATNLASAIYLNMDITMLGNYVGVEDVGIYTAAVRITRVISVSMACISNVILPRVTYYIAKGEIERFKKIVIDGGNYSLLLAIPASIGISCISKTLVMFFCGADFSAAYPVVVILSLSTCFSTLNRIFVWQLLIPLGMEDKVVFITSSGAVVNFMLNLFFIPAWGVQGAATTTVISEIVVFVISVCFCKSCFEIKAIFKNMWQYLIASVSIVVISVCCEYLFDGMLITMLAKIFFAVMSYGVILLLLKNEYVCSAVQYVKVIIGKKR